MFEGKLNEDKLQDKMRLNSPLLWATFLLLGHYNVCYHIGLPSCFDSEVS